jgi:hypothetical protein
VVTNELLVFSQVIHHFMSLIRSYLRAQPDHTEIGYTINTAVAASTLDNNEFVIAAQPTNNNNDNINDNTTDVITLTIPTGGEAIATEMAHFLAADDAIQDDTREAIVTSISTSANRPPPPPPMAVATETAAADTTTVIAANMNEAITMNETATVAAIAATIAESPESPAMDTSEQEEEPQQQQQQQQQPTVYKVNVSNEHLNVSYDVISLPK